MHRRVHDDRLREAWVRCPDDGAILVPTGDAYSDDLDGTSWFVAFRCASHPDEVIRVWRPELQPLLDEVLAGVEVASLPAVGPGLEPIDDSDGP